MNVIILIGIQATGKSTFYQTYYKDTHIRINFDMLKTRNREKNLLECCLLLEQPFVIDNTNLTKIERKRYITKIRNYNTSISGYYFSSSIQNALERNLQRGGKAIPEKGVLWAYNRLELPSYDEGFDHLYYVKAEDGEFIIQPYKEN